MPIWGQLGTQFLLHFTQPPLDLEFSECFESAVETHFEKMIIKKWHVRHILQEQNSEHDCAKVCVVAR